MITPLFKIEQSPDFITVKALLKYIKFSDFDYFIEGTNFRFSLKPYHLNIYLSHNLDAINPKNSFAYDIETHTLTAVIAKEESGVKFTNLDLLSTLFEKPKEKTAPSIKVEELSNTKEENDNHDTHKSPLNTITTEEELNNYLFELYSIPEIESLSLINTNSTEFYYGFNNLFNDVFDKRYEDMIEIIDLNPKKVSRKYRYLAMLEKESYDFVPERYIYDKYLIDPEFEEGEHLRTIMSLSINDLIKTLTDSMMIYNESEIKVLQDINKTKLSFIDTDNHFEFYLQLIDVFFAYLYDTYTTEYEHSSESGWTINKLSSVFSNLIDFNKNFYSQSKDISIDILNELVKNVLICSYRRVLVYPFYRNIELCNKIQKDICVLLSQPKVVFVKILIQIRNIFEKSEPRYLLNTLYIDPYLKWIQFHSDEKIFKILSETMNIIIISSNDLKLNLEHYENEFKAKEEEEANQMEVDK